MQSPLVLSLTALERQLIRESFESMKEDSNTVALVFYGRMFELDPTLRPLFKIGLAEQARKLMDTLSSAVDALDRFEELRPHLVDLGRKHTSYGTEPHHYETVRIALLWALRQSLGEQFDEHTEAAWDRLLRTITRAMLEICEEKSALLHFYETTTQEYVGTLSQLTSRMATVPKGEYARLRNAVEHSRVISENARIALRRHVRKHGC